MWFFEIGVTHLLGRKYQNRCWIDIIEIWYTFSFTTRHTPVISEYSLNFPPTSCHKYELVFLSKMFSREIEIDFLVFCNTVSFILTLATPNFSCSKKKRKKGKKKKKKTIHKYHPLLFFLFPISWVTRLLTPLYLKF